MSHVSINCKLAVLGTVFKVPLSLNCDSADDFLESSVHIRCPQQIYVGVQNYDNGKPVRLEAPLPATFPLQ